MPTIILRGDYLLLFALTAKIIEIKIFTSCKLTRKNMHLGCEEISEERTGLRGENSQKIDIFLYISKQRSVKYIVYKILTFLGMFLPYCESEKSLSDACFENTKHIFK